MTNLKVQPHLPGTREFIKIPSMIIYFTLSAIACERYLAIFMPFRYKRWATTARVRMVLLLCILCPIVLLAPLMATFNTWQATVPCVAIAVYPPWLMDLFVGNVVFCILVMMTTYIQIIKISMRIHKQVRVWQFCAGLLAVPSWHHTSSKSYPHGIEIVLMIFFVHRKAHK